MKTVHVTASKNYDIHIGSGLLAKAGEYANEVICGGKTAPTRRKCVIFSDTNVGPLHMQTLKESLEKYFEVYTFLIEAGEESKNMSTLAVLLEFMAEKKLSRVDFAVALGGGVVGDITGFAAAVYMRGIRFIQIPTSLLAAVDSSVGGKTAVDLEGGKNLAGAFYQPELVLCDTDALGTLPSAELANGMAEVIKYAVLKGGKLYSRLLEFEDKSAENSVRTLTNVCANETFADSTPEWCEKLMNDEETLSDIIFECVSIKRDYVAKDEFDRGDRMFLNLGHTYGHAVEKTSQFTIAHGQAVAIGLAKIMRECASEGLCSEEVRDVVIDMLAAYTLPTELPYPEEELESLIHVDKKITEKGVTFIKVRDIGDCFITHR